MSAKRDLLNHITEVDSDQYLINKKPVNQPMQKNMADELEKEADKDEAVIKAYNRQNNTQKTNRKTRRGVAGLDVKDSSGIMKTTIGVKKNHEPEQRKIQKINNPEPKQVQAKEQVVHQSTLNTPTESVKESVNNITTVKNIGKGFMHLYVTKTNSILNPLKFVADNFAKFFMAALLLGTPMAIVWYMITSVDYVMLRVLKETATLTYIHIGALYVAVTFAWFTSLFVMSMLTGMLKREVGEIAKIGDKT